MAVPFYGFADPASHAWMLLDTVRVEAYDRAIRQVVRPGHVVVDVGSGSGILAVLAVRAGARKVYAIERGPMSEVARAMMQDNGVHDRVEVLRVDARHATFDPPPDVIVTETLGDFGVDEDICALTTVVAKRCRPDVRVIPSGFAVVLAPLWDAGLARDLEALREVAGVRTHVLRRRLTNRVAVHRVVPADLMGAGVATSWLALPGSMMPTSFTQTAHADRAGVVNAIGAWFEATLTDDVSLSTGPHAPATCWPNFKFTLDPPLDVRAGDAIVLTVTPRMVMERAVWSWSARCGDEARAGDAMQGLVGDVHDVTSQLALAARGLARFRGSSQLDAWGAVLAQGALGHDVGTLAERLLAAMPEAYASLEDARQEVLRLLSAADAL